MTDRKRVLPAILLCETVVALWHAAWRLTRWTRLDAGVGCRAGGAGLLQDPLRVSSSIGLRFGTQ